MRISRRSLAATVVMGTAVAACFEAEHLSTTAQRAVVFMPATSYNFNGVPVGSGSSTNPDPYFTVRALSQTDDDYVTLVELVEPGCGSDFTLDLQPPLPGGSAEVYCSGMGSTTGPITPPGGSGVTSCAFIDYHFGATFHPSQPGAQTCQVNVTTVPKLGGAPTVTPVTLTGTGLSATYSMSAQPPSVNFGDVPLGTDSGPQTVTLSNTGSTAIQVGGMNSDATHFGSMPAVTGPFMLGAQQFQTFQVHCHTDTIPGIYNATLTFATGAAQGSLVQSVMLTCHGAATSVSVMPNPVDLGMHLMGDSPTTVPVIIKNTATVMVTLDGFTFAGEPTGEVTYSPPPTGPVFLGSGATASVNVRYAPTTERDFGSLGTMVFTVNGMATSAPLVGGAHTGSIGTNPASLDFGAVCAGSTASLGLTIFANAGGDVTLGNPTGPAAPFTASLPGTGRTLLAHHASEITLTATAAPPPTEMPGDRMDQIDVMTNIPGQTSVPIPVHAVVLAGGVSPTPAIVHFGPNDIGKPSSVQTVTLTNCGSGDLVLADASPMGTNGDEFAVVSPADVHVTIPTTKSQAFLVVMNPKTLGPKSAQLVFSFPGGPATVDLDGTGYGGSGSDTGGTKDRETYYACSVGAPSGLMPVALAGLLLRRRRRR